MKIAIIGTVASSILGFRKELIAELISNGCTVYTFAVDFTKEQKDEIRLLGAIAIDYKMSRTGMSPYRDLSNMLQLARSLRRISPDIVFSYFTKPVIYGSMAARIAGVPRIVGMLEGLGYVFTDIQDNVSIKTKLIRLIIINLFRISFSFTDKVIFLNNDDPKDLRNTYGLRIKNYDVLGPIGLDLAKYPFSPPCTDQISFIFVGRLLEEKGIKVFLEASEKVKIKYPYVNFIVLGGFDSNNPGSLNPNELDRYIKDNIITYPGQVNDVSEWLKASSVFVLPSHYREGFPRSTQEAMAIGRPVITTNSPGCRETVENGTNGYLIEPKNPKDLELRMIDFIKNPRSIIEMGVESHAIARNRFDSRKINRRLMNLIINKND